MNYNINLNSIDSITERTIFYQFFFGIMATQSSNYVQQSYPLLTFDTAIYEKMLQLTSNHPQVNYIDPLTDMTPLEFAIRDKKPLVVDVSNI